MEAIQRALRELSAGFDAVVSLGGESFLVYLLAEAKITNVLSDNKCAAGSGEFFIQQIGRMGLGLEEAIWRSFQGKVVPLASRCSVHCKSDITHKLNRQATKATDMGFLRPFCGRWMSTSSKSSNAPPGWLRSTPDLYWPSARSRPKTLTKAPTAAHGCDPWTAEEQENRLPGTTH